MKVSYNSHVDGAGKISMWVDDFDDLIVRAYNGDQCLRFLKQEIYRQLNLLMAQRLPIQPWTPPKDGQFTIALGILVTLKIELHNLMIRRQLDADDLAETMGWDISVIRRVLDLDMYIGPDTVVQVIEAICGKFTMSVDLDMYVGSDTVVQVMDELVARTGLTPTETCITMESADE